MVIYAQSHTRQSAASIHCFIIRRTQDTILLDKQASVCCSSQVCMTAGLLVKQMRCVLGEGQWLTMLMLS